MTNLGHFLLFVLVFSSIVSAQQGEPAVYTGIPTPLQQPSKVWYDASLFDSDVCLGIQKAIANVTPTTAGIVIDARNYRPPTAGSALPCTVNPFAVSGDPSSPIVLVVGGDSAKGAAGTQGGIVLLPGAAIATEVPWLVPQSWSVIGEGAQVTTIVPSTVFQGHKSRISLTTSTVSTTANNVLVSNGGTATWTSDIVGMVLMVCNGCAAGTADYTNAQVVGLVTDFVDSSHLNLGTGAQLTFSSVNPQPYALQAPLMAWATTTGCSTTGSPQCIGGLQPNTTGSVIQDIGLDCQGGLSAPVQGCIPFWDQYGQERTIGKRWQVSNFASQDSSSNAIPSIGIGIYGSTAQNGGPFEDIQMSPAAASSGPLIDSTTTCVEVGGALPVVGGLPVHPPMRGIHGLTCTGPHSPTAKFVGTGVDINTQNFSLSNAHFENLTTGVQIGKLGAATGVNVLDVTGGIVQGSADTHVQTIVDIKTNFASATPATSDINLSAIYQPDTADGPSVNDEISGNTMTEAVMPFYSLGNGTGTGVSSTRAVITTSSSVSSTPCASCVSTNTTLTSNSVLLGAGNHIATKSANFNITGAQLNIGQASTTSGVLGLFASGASQPYTFTPASDALGLTTSGNLTIGSTGATHTLTLGTSGTGSVTISPGSFSANHTINLPATTNNDTFGLLNQTQTWLQPQTFSMGVTTMALTTGNITLQAAGTHIQLSAANKDTAGTLTISSGTSSTTVSFGAAFTGSNHPACVATPGADANLTWWITYGVGSGNWTSFTLHLHSTATSNVTFDYHCFGNPN